MPNQKDIILGALCTELEMWQAQNNLPPSCAADQLADFGVGDDLINHAQAEYLRDFCARWDAACETEEAGSAMLYSEIVTTALEAEHGNDEVRILTDALAAALENITDPTVLEAVAKAAGVSMPATEGIDVDVDALRALAKQKCGADDYYDFEAVCNGEADRADLEFATGLMPVSPLLKAESYRTLVLSTAHIDPDHRDDIHDMANEKSNNLVLGRETGWIFKLTGEEYTDHFINDTSERNDLPSYLKAILGYAAKAGFRAVEFDRDADCIQGFPLFEE